MQEIDSEKKRIDGNGLHIESVGDADDKQKDDSTDLNAMTDAKNLEPKKKPIDKKLIEARKPTFLERQKKTNEPLGTSSGKNIRTPVVTPKVNASTSPKTFKSEIAQKSNIGKAKPTPSTFRDSNKDDKNNKPPAKKDVK